MSAIDLSALDGADGFRLDGINANDNSAGSVSSAGDINGDGFADLIIGATGADPNGADFAGETYVVFGGASGFAADIDLARLDGTDGFRLEGIDSYDNSGSSVSGLGDLNGDGFGDIVIGASGGAPNGLGSAGESYVIFGKATSFAANVSLASFDGTDGFRLNGSDANDLSGISVSEANDINGDGFADRIIGANRADPNGKNNGGETFVVFGKASGFGAASDLVDLDGTDGFRLNGADSGDYSGFSASTAGDLNGDGLSDLIIGAYGASPNGDSLAGESYVVFGRTSGFTASVNLATLDGSNGFCLKGIDANDQSGRSVSSAGDVNGDGFADLIIGAYGADANGNSNAGESYVVFGQVSGFAASMDLSTLDGSEGFRLDGVDASDFSGRSVSGAGDVNGDGFDDVIIGAGLADPNGDSEAGESYVVFGKADSFAASIDLAALDGATGFRLDGVDTFDRSGNSVHQAGDVNGDGFDDLIIGAYFAAADGDVTAGESYVVFGFDSGAVTHRGTDASETITGNAAANVIVGELGADTLIGAGGLDVLKGGGGDDVLEVLDLGFQNINGGTGTDTLRLSGAGTALDFTQAGSQLIASIEAIDLAGAGASVTLDALSILNLSEASNTVVVGGSGNERLVLADQNWSLESDDGATHTFDNGAAQAVIENTLSREVRGGVGSDTLLGGSGDDTLSGAGGNDALTGGDGADTADYSQAVGLVSINLTNGAAQDGDGGSDSLTSIENITGSGFNDILIGSALANTLIGGAGVDRLDGRGGDDLLLGGEGNDIYTVSDTTDLIIELAGQGTDRINAFTDFTNPDNVELLVGKFSNVGLSLTGNGTRDQITGANKINSPDTIFGLGGNDVLVGLVGNDAINGGAGNDRIFGNSGLDVINGGTGNDVVTGQQGADTFVIDLNAGRDTITDFNGAQDFIDLSAHGFASFAAIQTATSNINGSAVIDLGGANNLKLLGVLEDSLASDDFFLA